MTRDEAIALVRSFADSRRHQLGELLEAKLEEEPDPESFPDDIRDIYLNHWVIRFAYAHRLSDSARIWREWSMPMFDPTKGADESEVFTIKSSTREVKWHTPPMPLWFVLLLYATLPLNLLMWAYVRLFPPKDGTVLIQSKFKLPPE